MGDSICSAQLQTDCNSNWLLTNCNQLIYLGPLCDPRGQLLGRSQSEPPSRRRCWSAETSKADRSIRRPIPFGAGSDCSAPNVSIIGLA